MRVLFSNYGMGMRERPRSSTFPASLIPSFCSFHVVQGLAVSAAWISKESPHNSKPMSRSLEALNDPRVEYMTRFLSFIVSCCYLLISRLQEPNGSRVQQKSGCVRSRWPIQFSSHFHRRTTGNRKMKKPTHNELLCPGPFI
jgi:hypothetical protein